ncbi:MAG: hypothetical protein J2P37_28165 [Ktedonobacteraceae bacterium]|nr:hypothetical protein [Ktedonobacteraceae bacterium]MBO0794938.1 hypothetical protein [Ktedonobacteraceae bacterium]
MGRQQRRKRSQQAPRTIPWWGISVAAVTLILLVGGILFLRQQGANTPANAAYDPVDQISCDSGEHNTYHVHAHLSLYIEGQQVQVPANIGIASDQSCLYWLHTHDETGVIHIEAPQQTDYSFGKFLEVWQRFPQLNYPTQLAKTEGWQVYVDGKPFTGDWHTIPMKAHTLITMVWNTPNVTPDTTYSWGNL